MYEEDGEKYFVVDGHMHFWTARHNWVPGAEQYAKGSIGCCHAYRGLGPSDAHRPLEHFPKYAEDDLMQDVFADSHVRLAELKALGQAGKVTLHTRMYPLAAAADALADLIGCRVRGRAIPVR